MCLEAVTKLAVVSTYEGSLVYQVKSRELAVSSDLSFSTFYKRKKLDLETQLMLYN